VTSRIDVDADVAVIGGGPAGLSAAIILARMGLSTIVIEAAAAKGFRIGETAPPSLQPLLLRLGVWESFLAGGHLRTGAIGSAWGEENLAWRDSFTHPLGSGWHLDRAGFERMLACKAEAAGVTLLIGNRVVGVEREQGYAEPEARWSVQLRQQDGQPRRTTAAFLLDASGRSALIARQCDGAPVHVDRLMCAYAVLSLSSGTPQNLHSLIESAADGWWYAAQLPDGNVLVALFTDAAILRRLSCFEFGAWQNLLFQTRHISAFLDGSVAACSGQTKIAVNSASSHCLQRMYGPGWAAAGDAATAWDPLASAGIVQAVRSGIESADAIQASLAGNQNLLAAYQERIQQAFTRYLYERRAYYALEKRWPDSPFWSIRSGVTQSGSVKLRSRILR